MSRPFVCVDAFAESVFSGNPCAVVFGADDLAVETRLAFTRETRLSECAFVQRSESADFGVRYYVANDEIKMAGHPTIATITALIDRGMVKPPARLTLEVGAGVLPIEVSADGEIAMVQMRPRFGGEWDPAEIAPLFRLSPEDFAATPQLVSTGTPFLVALLKDKDALRRAERDEEALARFRERVEGEFHDVFLATLGGETPAGDTFSRLLMSPPEPPEDPFTGSATGCMAAYLWSRGLIDSPDFIAEQGHWMGRPGAAKVSVIGPRDAIEGVRLAGRGVVLMRGEAAL